MARQAWNRKEEWDRAVLEHARMLLVALAALVDRAAGLPAVERLRFLAVMGRGEAEARRLIVAMAFDPWAGAPAGAVSDAPPVVGDATLLAARFRMLALAVEAMLARGGAEPPCRHAASRSASVLSRKPRLTAQHTPSPALRATSPPAGPGCLRP